MGSLESQVELTEMGKRKGQIGGSRGKLKKSKLKIDLESFKKEDDYGAGVDFELREKSSDGWSQVVLPDAVLRTGDLDGLGMFEEIDGSQYEVIKNRKNKQNVEEKIVESQERTMLEEVKKEEEKRREEKQEKLRLFQEKRKERKERKKDKKKEEKERTKTENKTEKTEDQKTVDSTKLVKTAEA